MFACPSTQFLIGIFTATAIVILIGGTRMTGLADRLADRTGFGEAMVGGVLLGAATSLSGVIVSLTSTLDGRASLAFSNGIGGIAAQTAFLALADLLHRRANIEHAAADLANVFQATLLMLTLPLLAWTAPEVAIMGVHPVSIALIVVYVGGVYATNRVREEPMWEPVDTRETEPDLPDEPQASDGSTVKLGLQFGMLMLIMGVAGWAVAKTAGVAVDRFELRASAVGALMIAVVTSLPELVTTLAAGAVARLCQPRIHIVNPCG